MSNEKKPGTTLGEQSNLVENLQTLGLPVGDAIDTVKRIASTTAELPPGWLPITEAPMDGQLLLLLIPSNNDDRTEDNEGAFDRTIGSNNFLNTGEDYWHFVGWDWNNDMFINLTDPVQDRSLHQGGVNHGPVGFQYLPSIAPALTEVPDDQEATAKLCTDHNLLKRFMQNTLMGIMHELHFAGAAEVLEGDYSGLASWAFADWLRRLQQGAASETDNRAAMRTVNELRAMTDAIWNEIEGTESEALAFPESIGLSHQLVVSVSFLIRQQRVSNLGNAGLSNAQENLVNLAADIQKFNQIKEQMAFVLVRVLPKLGPPFTDSARVEVDNVVVKALDCWSGRDGRPYEVGMYDASLTADTHLQEQVDVVHRLVDEVWVELKELELSAIGPAVADFLAGKIYARYRARQKLKS